MVITGKNKNTFFGNFSFRFRFGLVERDCTHEEKKTTIKNMYLNKKMLLLLLQLSKQEQLKGFPGFSSFFRVFPYE